MVEVYAAYFRPQVRGFENVPDAGPFLLVGNHSGGAMPPDMPILMTAWWRQRGVDEPVYGLFHSIVLRMPGVRERLAPFGALEASWTTAQTVLEDGGIVLVYPGGDHEAFRPWLDRNRIDFAGRTGFVRLALRTGVPVVPVVTTGIQDAIFVLSRGERLARFMPHRLLRLKVAPVILGPPWGLSLGLPTIPLPTKATVELGRPIDLAAELGPGAADDEIRVQAGYDLVTSTMQRTLDRLAAERR